MKAVVRLLPTGNVTVTYWDPLRRTYRVRKHTHRWTEPCTYGDVYAPVSDEHAYSNWYVGLVNLCLLTHLHMSWAVVAQAVIRGDRLCHFPPRVTAGAGPQRDRDVFHSLSLSNDTTCFCLFFFRCILVFSSDEVTFEPLQIQPLSPLCVALLHVVLCT